MRIAFVDEYFMAPNSLTHSFNPQFYKNIHTIRNEMYAHLYNFTVN